jgi:hypothetical protein
MCDSLEKTQGHWSEYSLIDPRYLGSEIAAFLQAHASLLQAVTDDQDTTHDHIFTWTP